MTVKELVELLYSFDGDREVRVHVGSLDDFESYGSRILFVGLCAHHPGKPQAVFIEADSDVEYDL